MPRIRTIKPEFPQSESMGRVSRDARLLFIELWTLCDDSGRTRAASRMLASLLFPYDDDAPALIDGWLAELEREHCLDRYLVDGQSYIQVHKWLIHQKIDHPSQSKFPAFEDSSRKFAKPREKLPRTKDQGPRTKEGIKEKTSCVSRTAAGFDLFWSTWPTSPRKVAKAACLKKWESGRLEPLAAAIVGHVTAMRASKQWQDGFEPTPLTYLNQRRWEDEVSGAPAENFFAA